MVRNLREASYNTVAQQMITREPGVPSALFVFGGAMESESPSMIGVSRYELDFSLGAQLDQLTAPGAEAPEAYVFTAYSAIPIADAVRGYYEERGLPLPPFTYVNANSSHSYARYNPGYCQSTEAQIDTAAKNLEAEAERMRETLPGVTSACIVEQYVSSGLTIRYAREILNRSGVEKVSAVRGRWYDENAPHEVDLANVTSIHAKTMFAIGQAAVL